MWRSEDCHARCSTRILRLFMGGSRKEAILFERAVASYRTNDEFLGYRQLNKSCNSAHVGARYHC